ncbi:hypothetical protein EON65_48530 [archaeon]|nr:MAG: hypothetical protein EON65_48530 [archaeon]
MLSQLDCVKVLAYTTTFSAKNHVQIYALRRIVRLVEIVAELHESHILPNLHSDIRHLVIYGDHKQLSPKLQCYKLTKESGYGLDFDVNVIERLVLNGYS